METYAVYFRPRGSLASSLSSDTLFGAVCWGIQVLDLKADVGAWLESHLTPPFAFSATFPVWFHGPESNMRFYPRPANFEPSPAIVQSLADSLSKQRGENLKSVKLLIVDKTKLLRGVSYISEEVFTKIVLGSLSPGEVLRDLVTKQAGFDIFNGILLSSSEKVRLVKAGFSATSRLLGEVQVQRNHIDRVAGATVEGLLFYENETRFAPGIGLWALLRTSADDLAALIQPALRYLADTGFGANRIVGKGHFDISITPMPALPEAQKPNAVILLSRYLPDNAEMDFSKPLFLAYKLTTLRPKREQKFPKAFAGQATQPVYKEAVRMFEPGAMFPLQHRREVYGRLALVLTAEAGGPVYQSGAALPVFMFVQEE